MARSEPTQAWREAADRLHGRQERQQEQRPDTQAGRVPMPPPDLQTVICSACTAHYLDTEPGRSAHVAVFGHQPKHQEN